MGRGVAQPHAQRVFAELDRRDLERRRVADLEVARDADHVVDHERPRRDPDRDRGARPGQAQLVVAGGEPAQVEHALLERERVERVAHVGAAPHLEQPGALAGQLPLHERHRQRLAGSGVERARVGVAVDEQGAGERRPLGRRGPYGYHVRQRAEGNPPRGVGLERLARRLDQLGQEQRDLHGAVGLGLAGLAAQLERPLGPVAQQVERLDPARAVDPVHGQLAADREGDRRALAHGRDLAAQGQAQRREPVRDQEGVGGLAGLAELERRHLVARADPVAVDRLDHQPRPLEQLERDRRAVEVQPGPHADRGLAPRQQRLALDQESGAQLVLLALVAEVGQHAQRPVAEHDRPQAGLPGEGHRDRPLGVGQVVAPAHPHRGVLQRATRLVEHGERLPGGGGAHQVPQPAAPDERAAAAPPAHEVDHVQPRPRELREREPPAHPPDRRVGVVEPQLVVGEQALEREVGVDLGQGVDIQPLGVELVDLHQQGGDVLHVELERDLGVGREPLGVGRRQLELDPPLQLGHLRRLEQGVPALGVAPPVEQLHLGEHGAHPGGVERGGQLDHLVHVVLLEEELTEERLHQGAVVADRLEPGGVAVVQVQPREVAPVAGGALEPAAGDPPRDAGQRQVLQHALAVERALREVRGEQVVEHVHLERVERPRQRLEEGPGPLQERPARGGVERRVGRGLQAPQDLARPALLALEPRPALRQPLELLERQEGMDRERPEPAAPRVRQLPRHERDEVRHVGPPQPAEEVTQLLDRELAAVLRRDPRQGAVGERRQAAGIARQGLARQRVARDPLGREPGREVRARVLGLALVVQPVRQLPPQVVERGRGVARVAEQGQAPLDLDHPRLAVMPIGPLGEELAHLVVALERERVQAVVVVVVGGARDQLGQRGLAVLGEGEPLAEIDLLRLRRARREQQRGQGRPAGGARHGIRPGPVGP